MSPPQRVRYLSAATLPSATANSVQVVQMCSAFAVLGCSVTLIARPGDDPSSTAQHYGVGDGFTIDYVARPPVPGLGPLRFALGAARRHRDGQPVDLIYARHLPTLAIAARSGTPFVFESHALTDSRLQRAVQARLFRLPGFRRLVVISSALRRDYLAAFPELDAAKVLVAHDGANAAQEHSGSALPWPGRAGCLQVGYVGHLYEGKGMEVIAEVSRRMQHVDFHVVGGRPEDLATWKARIGWPNVHFHGYVPHGELAPYFAKLDVALLPLQPVVRLTGNRGDIGRWTSPLKLFEYMAHGKAIVASSLPVLLEVVTPDEHALVCDPADPLQWVEAVERLHDDALRTALGRSARALLMARYTWTERARRVLDGT